MGRVRCFILTVRGSYLGLNFKIRNIQMEITSIKNEYGARVYHVVDGGCIQEFWTYKEAKSYIDYINQIGVK